VSRQYRNESSSQFSSEYLRQFSLKAITQHVFIAHRKAWFAGIAGYSLMLVLNLVLSLWLGQPPEVSQQPALAKQLQQTDASFSEITQAIDKLAERKALYEQ